MTNTEALLRAALSATPAQREIAMRALTDKIEGEDIEPYLTRRQLAKKLNISTATLWRLRVPGHMIGSTTRFKAREVIAFLEGRSSSASRKRKNSKIPRGSPPAGERT